MMTIQLKSPFSDESAVFRVNPNIDIIDESNEILQILKFLTEDHPELKYIIDNYNSIKANLKNHEKAIYLCDKFNEWVDKYKINKVDKEFSYASRDLIKFMMHFIYNRSVFDPEKLNHYEPFSPQVYGETSFDLIDQLLKRIKIKKSDIFVDLGSGVGNVVLHIAAAVDCKMCYGFEKAEWPAFFAIRMENEFKYWMNFFGKRYSPFKLYKADFLSDEETIDIETSDSTIKKRITMNEYVKDIINESNLIFVNNYAFGAEVDHQLKLRFCNMLEGSVIVSSKPFCPLNFRINSRNLNDIGTILNVSEFEPLNGKVSWTDKPINYYFHKIDRTLLEKYFERLKNPSKSKEEDSNDHEKSKSNKIASPLSCSGLTNSQTELSSSDLTSPLSICQNSSSPNSSKEFKERKKNIKKLEEESESCHKKNKRKKISNENKISKNKIKDNLSSRYSAKKKAKLISKNEKNESRDRNKSIDKKLIKTLDTMHSLVKNSSKSSPIISNLNSSTLNHFNINKMTNLKDDNLDNKLLKDCLISPKVLKQFRNDEENLIKNSCENDESQVRKELGDELIDSIDNYLSKCRRQFISLFMYSKSNKFSDKIKLEIQNEMKIKNDLIVKKENLEQKTNELLKSNVNMLKSKACDLGISNFSSPYDLIKFARDILSDHEYLVQKIKYLQQSIDNSEMRFNKKPANDSENSNRDEIENNQTAILNKILDKLHPSNTDEKINSSKSQKNISRLLTNNETKEYNQLEKNDDSEICHKNDDELNAINSLNSNQIIEIKSIESNETVTATEKEDVENEDNIEDFNLDVESKEKNDSIRRSSVDSKKSSIESFDESRVFIKNSELNSNKIDKSCNKSSHKKTNISNNYSSKQSIDQIFSKDIDKTDSLKNFKIPKQHIDKSKPNESINRTLSSENSAELTRSNFFNSKNQINLINYSNSDMSHQNKSYAPYYHPKKNQFRQYMMESISTNSESTHTTKYVDSLKNNSNDNRYSASSQYPNQDYYNSSNNDCNNEIYKNSDTFLPQSYPYHNFSAKSLNANPNNEFSYQTSNFRSGKFEMNDHSPKTNSFGNYSNSSNKKF